jgi:hypothetical protein
MAKLIQQHNPQFEPCIEMMPAEMENGCHAEKHDIITKSH